MWLKFRDECILTCMEYYYFNVPYIFVILGRLGDHLFLCLAWQYSVIRSQNFMYVWMHSSGNCNHTKQDYQYDSNNYLIIITYIILFNLKVYSDFIISWIIWTWYEHDLNSHLLSSFRILSLRQMALTKSIVCWATTKALRVHSLEAYSEASLSERIF